MLFFLKFTTLTPTEKNTNQSEDWPQALISA